MQARGHRLIASILEVVHDTHKADERQTLEFLWLEALAQLVDLQIYHGKDAAIVMALEALLPGKINLRPPYCKR